MKGPFTEILVCLLFAHIVGDFLLQTSADVRNKHRIPVLSKHAAIAGVVSYAVCGLWKMWPIPLAVFLGHFLVDYAKLRLRRKFREQEPCLFLVDQAVHLVILLLITYGVVILYPSSARNIWWINAFGPWYPRILIFMGGFILTVRAGAMVMEMAVRPFLVQLKEGAGTPQKGLQNGGRFIGQLERAMIFLFVMAGHPSVIGFLIAAKSILRFGDVRDRENRMEAEYIIIGTLMSFLLGLLVAYGAKLLMSMVG